jgi:hypothetical protein
MKTRGNAVIRAVRSTYRQLIVDREQEVTFWVLGTFLPTFLLARALVYLAPQIFVTVGGTHIHHFTWGILLLAISGYLALTLQTPSARPRIAALYGVGLALAFDEFGMWLRLQDDYWVRQSYDAVLVILVWLVNAAYFHDFWLRLLRHFFRFTAQK